MKLTLGQSSAADDYVIVAVFHAGNIEHSRTFNKCADASAMIPMTVREGVLFFVRSNFG